MHKRSVPNLKLKGCKTTLGHTQELQNRGARLLSQELSLLEQDEGEVINERFIKALTVEVEDITNEAIRTEQQVNSDLVGAIEKSMEETTEFLQTRMLGLAEVFLQTRMVGLAEVRRNMEGWRPSMMEAGALVVESEAVEPVGREKMEELKKEAVETGRGFDLVPANAIFSSNAGSGRRKCRGVACGNYARVRNDESSFASGAGGGEVRLLLKAAAL